MQPFLVLLATFLEQAKQKFIAASQAFAIDLLHAFGFDTDVMTINIPLWNDLYTKVLRRTFQVRLIHETKLNADAICMLFCVMLWLE